MRANNGAPTPSSNGTRRYHDFVSASLWSRLAAAPGILFSFDPLDPAALACAREDISDVLRLWAGWVARDAGAGPLGGDAAGECRALTEAAARFLKYDPVRGALCWAGLWLGCVCCVCAGLGWVVLRAACGEGGAEGGRARGVAHARCTLCPPCPPQAMSS